MRSLPVIVREEFDGLAATTSISHGIARGVPRRLPVLVNLWGVREYARGARGGSPADGRSR